MLTLLQNADLYAPKPLGLCDLLVGAGQILWIGVGLPPLPAALDVAVVDLDGARVIPGLIDGHAHVTGGGGEAGFASRVPGMAVSHFSRSAITTVVGLLGTDDITRDTKSLLAHTRGLREEGLNAFCYTGGYHLPAVTLTGSVASDIVHLDPVIGVGELAISDHRSSQPSLGELLRVASEVHVAGLITGKAGIVHLHLGDGERGLSLLREALAGSELPGRVFNPTHVNRRIALFEEALALPALGCTIDVTAFPVDDGDDGLTASAAVKRYLDSDLPGDKITVSSDGGGCLPHFDADGVITRMGIGDPAALLATLDELLQQNVTLDAALRPFTSNVAALLRLHKKGRIAVGMDADLAVLGKIGALHASDVMIGGQWHRREGEQLRLGQFE